MGSREGALKAAKTNLKNDPQFYVKLGELGGKTPRTAPRGFAAFPKEKLLEVSRKGGQKGRRK